MKIEAADTEISKLLKSGYLVIPRFQRPYSWKTENLRDFWADITENDEGNYFIGSMVIYSMGRDMFGVVDGQQRLTTITILLCAIRDKLSDLGEKELALGVHNYIETADRDNVKGFVLKTETSFPYLQQEIQKFGEPEVKLVPGEEEVRLQAAYDYLSRQIDDYLKKSSNGLLSRIEKRDKHIATLKHLREVVLQLKAIKIELDNEDDAYVIFETLNTRGQDLTLSDLVKNSIGSLISKKDDVDVFKVIWDSITNNIGECGQSVKLDTFFVHSWSSRFSAVTKLKAFKAIKNAISSSVNGGDEAKSRDIGLSHLRAFATDSTMYQRMYAPEAHLKNSQYMVKDSLLALRVFNVEQQTTYVLSLLRAHFEGKISYKTLRKALKAVESFHFQFNAITSSRSSGSISAMYSRAAKYLHEAADTNAAGIVIQDLTLELGKRRPTLEEFSLGFRGIKYNVANRSNALAKYILLNFAQHENITFDVDSNRLTIEHVHPRSSIDANWSPDIVDGIGNLISLSEARNKTVGSKSYEDKNKHFKDWQGSIPKFVFDSQDWSPEIVNLRGQEMAKTAYNEVWKLE